MVAAQQQVKVGMSEAARSFKFKIVLTGVKRFKVRFFVACLLVRLAGWISPMNTEVNYEVITDK